MNKDTYTPHGKTADVLDRAWDILQTVPYQVSARWLFYRLLQEGFYNDKAAYKNQFVKAVSSARHANYKQWRPDTLADETREVIERGNGFSSVQSWLDAVAARLECKLDKWQNQPYYVELWYEARAMSQQFQYYTEHIQLRPMAGQPSIPYKYQAARELSRIDIPVVILYFGDLDPAGEIISAVIEKDVRKWCDVDFQYIHCGLTLEQVRRYNVPENPEKPGQYQWEALADDAARDIITAAVSPFVRQGAFSEIEEQEAQATFWLSLRLSELADEWRGGATK